SGQLFACDHDRKSLLDRKGRDRNSGAYEQLKVIEELSDAVEEQAPLALRSNDLVRSKALAFLDIPDDVGVDAAAFAGQQVATHVSEKKGAQHLKTIYRAREVRCLHVYRATHFCEARGTGSTNSPDFRINAAQAEG